MSGHNHGQCGECDRRVRESEGDMQQCITHQTEIIELYERLAALQARREADVEAVRLLLIEMMAIHPVEAEDLEDSIWRRVAQRICDTFRAPLPSRERLVGALRKLYPGKYVGLDGIGEREWFEWTDLDGIGEREWFEWTDLDGLADAILAELEGEHGR